MSKWVVDDIVLPTLVYCFLNSILEMFVPNELTMLAHSHHYDCASDAAGAENLFTAAGIDTGSTVEWGTLQALPCFTRIARV